MKPKTSLAKNDKRPTIFIVEDNEIMLNLYATVFKLCGWKIEFQKFGRDALKQIPKAKPDLVLLDIALPDIDGFAVLEELKAKIDTKNIPVIMITNYFDAPEDIQRGLNLGAKEYLLKADYTPKQLTLIISKTINVNCAIY